MDPRANGMVFTALKCVIYICMVYIAGHLLTGPNMMFPGILYAQGGVSWKDFPDKTLALGGVSYD